MNWYRREKKRGIKAEITLKVRNMKGREDNVGMNK